MDIRLYASHVTNAVVLHLWVSIICAYDVSHTHVFIAIHCLLCVYYLLGVLGIVIIVCLVVSGINNWQCCYNLLGVL